MTQQYLRYCTVTADGVGSIDFSSLRCRFHITQATMQAPNLCRLMLATNQPVGLGGANLLTNSPVAPYLGAG